MEPEVTTMRQVLRNIGCTQLYKYLTLPSQKQQLGYYDCCVPSPDHPQKYNQMYGLDCQMIQTDHGQQLVRAIIVKQNQDVVYDKWFNISEGTKVTDYITHITGITEQILKNKAGDNLSYSQKDKLQIEECIKGKIIVGHDLANDIRMLKINHKAFIDTLSIFPHNYGLPFKSKLRDLACLHLTKRIQILNHNPKQDALTALQLVRLHVSDGRGTIEVEPFPQKKYQSHEEMMKDAELDPSKFELFVLRGSQALGLTIQTQDYKSDHDYVVVYNTGSTLNGRLIKLPNIDITFFDQYSFLNYIDENDISYLELFFLPQKYVYINKFHKPKLNLIRLRASLGFHLSKSAAKYKRIMAMIAQKPGYKWKILKTVHMKMRFMSSFLQLYQQFVQQQNKKQYFYRDECIDDIFLFDYQIDLFKVNDLWVQICEMFKKTNDFQAVLKYLQQKQIDLKTQVNSSYPKRKKLRYRGSRCNRNDKNQRSRRNFKKQTYSQMQSKLQVPKDMEPHQTLKTIQIIQKYGHQILQQYRIAAKKHRLYPNLIQFHYLQSASFNSEPPKQCRGMIVDSNQNYRIVALPYYKFFDYNDPKYSTLSTFDFQSAKVYNKQDGSLAFLYFYDQKWHVASSTVPDGMNKYCFARNQTTTEFSLEFWKIFHILNFQLPQQEDRNKTFIFEILSKNHIIVVNRHQSSLVLHGVRNINTLQEEDHLKYGQKYKWRVAEPLDIKPKSIQQIVNKVNQLNPLKNQGYVLCDKNWNRIKVKNPGYVRINWLGELNLGYNQDPKRYILIQIVLSGEAQSFMNYCPEWKETISEFLKKIQSLNKQVCQIYDEIKGLPRKQFAGKVHKYSKDFQSFLFAIRGKQSRYYGKVEDVLNPKKFYTFINQYIP